MAEERIQKIMAEQGLCSRRAAEQIIAEGRVKVNGQYIYGTDGKNTLKFTDTAANAVNTITLSDTDGVIITSNTSVLRFNVTSGQMRFRYFKASTYTNQQAIQLYKLEG